MSNLINGLKALKSMEADKTYFKDELCAFTETQRAATTRVLCDLEVYGFIKTIKQHRGRMLRSISVYTLTKKGQIISEALKKTGVDIK